ncbi:hypothetical protein RLW55_00895 [Hyphomicrobium sp. B1]|uniref:hypothetical protein n=1 Tax=unclassified Hyphomicrobium TaxID=2619925 RepID=UPI00391DB53A
MDYISICRSNYFKVRDAKRFVRWCRYHGLEHWTYENEGETFHAIGNDDGGGWPSYNHDGEFDFEIERELQSHLDPSTVAIIYSADHEGLRYVGGHAVAVHATKPPTYLGLKAIVALARTAYGPEVTIDDDN